VQRPVWLLWTVASTRDWFESVAEARRRARRRLPRSVFLAIEAGAEAGVTRADNVAAFREIRFAPPRAAGTVALPAERDLRTSVLGVDIALPVIASPVGVQAVHPLGEVAVAMGTRDAGTARPQRLRHPPGRHRLGLARPRPALRP
jgi:pre-mycofactocin synthase